MTNFSPTHVKTASPILRLVAVLATIIGVLLVLGGIYLANADKLAETKFTILGNHLSSTSVGVAVAFLGAIVIIYILNRVLKSVDHLSGLPDQRQSGFDHISGGGGGGQKFKLTQNSGHGSTNIQVGGSVDIHEK